MATAHLESRNLVITHGTGDDAISVTVRPATAANGLKLLTHIVQMNSAILADDELDLPKQIASAEEVTRLALGDTETDHPAWDQMQSLRDEEQEVTFWAAVLWNAKGGRTADVQAYLEDQDYPKALLRLLERTGLLVLGQSRTSPSGA